MRCFDKKLYLSAKTIRLHNSDFYFIAFEVFRVITSETFVKQRAIK